MSLEELFEQKYGEVDDAVYSSAPGRVNLIGGHTDYNQGFVLPVGIQHKVKVLAKPREDQKFRVYTDSLQKEAKFELDNLKSEDDWTDYIKGVISEFDNIESISGADIVLDSEVPIGSGLSSSAALEVAVAGALREINNVGIGDRELAFLCQRAENNFVGVNCGILDQFSSVFAEEDKALFIDCKTHEIETVEFDSTDFKVLVTNTNVDRELESSEYNKRRRTCESAVEVFDEILDRDVGSLRDVSVQEFEEYKSELGEVARNRAKHVILENEGVEKAKDAVKKGKVENLGKLIQKSHEGLRDLYEVSSQELDHVVEVASNFESVHGSRMVGAGFGGCAISIVEEDKIDDVKAEIRRSYSEEFGINPEFYICKPSSGLETDTR